MAFSETLNLFCGMGRTEAGDWSEKGVLKCFSGELWTKKVNAFDVSRSGQQLSELNTPYFFITIGMTGDLKKPATEYGDHAAGETNWHLYVSGFRHWDKKEYYLGPNISVDQLHFLTFMGDFWGMGKEPRFNDELAIGWNKHTAKYGGTISWDVPLTDSGLITDPYMEQLALLSKNLISY